jgi:carbon monoxide dehydrogenase subunit G
MRCESAVDVAAPPSDVFPWLLDADMVPRWMTGLEDYEPLDPGPPRRAVLRFEGSGFRAANEYTVRDSGSGANVTWVISGDATSFKAKLLVPMVQAKLQEKLETDLARLRALLASETAPA